MTGSQSYVLDRNFLAQPAEDAFAPLRRMHQERLIRCHRDTPSPSTLHLVHCTCSWQGLLLIRRWLAQVTSGNNASTRKPFATNCCQDTAEAKEVDSPGSMPSLAVSGATLPSCYVQLQPTQFQQMPGTEQCSWVANRKRTSRTSLVSLFFLFQCLSEVSPCVALALRAETPEREQTT